MYLHMPYHTWCSNVSAGYDDVCLRVVYLQGESNPRAKAALAAQLQRVETRLQREDSRRTREQIDKNIKVRVTRQAAQLCPVLMGGQLLF
jgi:hypothetical protein